MFQCQMLPSPVKPHYSFNTTDLARIWQGMMNASADVIIDVEDILALWKHECCRVISDRLTYDYHIVDSNVVYNTTVA